MSEQQQPLDNAWSREVLHVCEHFRRGLITAEEACWTFLRCIEPLHVADCVGLLPDNLRAMLPAALAKWPASDEDWVNFHGIGQFDGNEWTRVNMICECRANIEAARAYVLGEVSPPAAADFVDRIREDYRIGMDEIRLSKKKE